MQHQSPYAVVGQDEHAIEAGDTVAPGSGVKPSSYDFIESIFTVVLYLMCLSNLAGRQWDCTVVRSCVCRLCTAICLVSRDGEFLLGSIADYHREPCLRTIWWAQVTSFIMLFTEWYYLSAFAAEAAVGYRVW